MNRIVFVAFVSSVLRQYLPNTQPEDGWNKMDDLDESVRDAINRLKLWVERMARISNHPLSHPHRRITAGIQEKIVKWGDKTWSLGVLT